ncbi:MAG: MFS transporter, partial [Rhodoferax sp.]|nr:MFS transporter [Rhodoferax sp.]
SLSLLAAYGWHAARVPHPLLRLGLLRIRTFRVSVLGGFVTRLAVGGMPFLLPLLYQVGMGLPAWQSGLLMMPAAAAAMGMKVIATALLRRYGFRRVLTVNTVLVGCTVAAYSQVDAGTPLVVIVGIGLLLGLFNSLQYSSMNSMAYADIDAADVSMASTMASTMQQMSMSFGLALGSLVTGLYLAGLPQTDRLAVTGALHHAFLTLAVLTLLSSLSFRSLRDDDGESVSRGAV